MRLSRAASRDARLARELDRSERPLGRLLRWTGPKELETHPAGWVVASLAAVVILGVFVVERATPVYVTISSLDLLPLLVGGWLLSGRMTAALTALAVCTQAAAGALGEVHWATAGSYVAGSVATALAAHVGASNSAAARASRERELGLLLDTAKKLNSLASPKEIVAEIVLAAAGFVSQGPFGVKARATLFRVAGDDVKVVAEHDDLGISLKGHDYPVPSSFVELIDSGARGFGIDELPPSLAEAYRKARVTSIAAAPVRVGGELFGFLAAASRDERRAATRELGLLKGLADVGGLAMSQADRLIFERSRARLYAALFDMSLATAEATAPQEVGKAVLKQARELADADVALVAFEEGGLLRPAAVYPRSGVTATGLDLKRGVVGQAYQRRQPVVVNNRRQFTEQADRSILPRGGSLAAVPLLAGKQAMGVLVVGARRHSFHGEQLEALRVLASQLGPAMDAATMRSSLIESEGRFRSLYAGLACGVVIHDVSANLVDANWAALQLLGVSRKAIERKAFLGPEWRVRLPGGIEVPLSNRPPGAVIEFKRPIQNLVVEVTPPRGSPRWLRIDSRELQQREQTVWVVTSFFEVPGPPPPGRRQRA